MPYFWTYLIGAAVTVVLGWAVRALRHTEHTRAIAAVVLAVVFIAVFVLMRIDESEIPKKREDGDDTRGGS